MDLETKDPGGRRDDSPLINYPVKISLQTWERIQLINAHTPGLNEQIRQAIEMVTSLHWEHLPPQIKERD